MSLYRDTDKMELLSNIFMPHLNEHAELPKDAPGEALAEYKRLAKEQEEFALSL